MIKNIYLILTIMILALFSSNVINNCWFYVFNEIFLIKDVCSYAINGQSMTCSSSTEKLSHSQSISFLNTNCIKLSSYGGIFDFINFLLT